MIDAIATDQSYLPMKFSRNKLTHTIDAADPALENRVGLKYELTLQVPEFAFSENFQDLHTSEGREAPVDPFSGVQTFSGAEFRYNFGRNGKIDGLLTYTKPRRLQNTMSVLLTQTMAFSMLERVTGGQPAVDTSRQLGKYYAIKAGLANEDFYAYGDTFFNKYQLGARQFLTWQPNYKRVATDQEEYLHFLLNFTPKPQILKLRVQSYNADGIAGDAYTAMSVANPVLYSVVCCPVGMKALNIPSDAARYDIWLSNQHDKRVSEVRTYMVDHSHEEFDRSIIFVNSLGGWDTLRLTGQAQRNLKVVQTTAAIERPANAGVDFSELKIISIEGEYDLQISTGFFKRDAVNYLKYLNELLLSEEIYLITDKGHRPLQLTTTGLNDQSDNQDLIARTFGFRILDTVENFSNLPAAEPLEERETTWRGISIRQVLDGFGKRTGYLEFARLEKVYQDDNSLVKPYTVKANSPGDPDYVPAIFSTIPPGSTPYPNALLSKPGTFLRSNCETGRIGGAATITIPAGFFGGENEGDADNLAKARYESLNTQGYADSNGTCLVNTVPVKFGILHKVYPDGSGDFTPVVDLRSSQGEIISNTIASTPPEVRLSDALYPPGVYNLIIEVEYVNSPTRPFLMKIPQKNREIKVTTTGFVVFENVTVNSSDHPLVIEVLPL